MVVLQYRSTPLSRVFVSRQTHRTKNENEKHPEEKILEKDGEAVHVSRIVNVFNN